MIFPRGRWRLFIFLLFTFQAASAQDTFYVDGANGNDGNPGTGLTLAWRTIQKACSSAVPGSTVYITGGVYHENIVVEVSGAFNNPITFRNYNADSVILDGTGTSGTTMISMTDKSFLVFEGMTIRNLIKQDAQGILVECSPEGYVNSLEFRDLSITHIGWTDNPLALPLPADNAQPFIVYGEGSTAQNAVMDVEISNCRVFGNITGFSEAVSLDGNIAGFNISNNIVYDNTNIGIDVAGNYGVCSDPMLDHAREGWITDNTCHDNISLYATSAGIYADGAQTVFIERNRCYNNGYGIEVGCEMDGFSSHITVTDNLLYGNLESGMAVGGYTTQTTGQVVLSLFRNNTFFMNDVTETGSGELYITKASDCWYTNNIFYANEQGIHYVLEGILPQADNHFDYNGMFQTPWDAGFVNPVLPDPDLHLSEGSPCIDTGDPSTQLFQGETDFQGSYRIVGNTIDQGAYEKGPGIGISGLNGGSSAISIFPNPAADFVTISMEGIQGSMAVAVFDIRGERVITGVAGRDRITLDISTLTPGLYFVQVVSGNKTMTGKFLH